ncbi:uncharacterized protein LOC127839950 [Dreissena polymorpha]|uniref:uncharacterized protein LOC127839950 n=1 Tax=Dreissena polymorpha TaxID=45954 RepID=UPI002264FD57|nr:uncharacterized protein LOC127839950 [Dreissena polymorpha]
MPVPKKGQSQVVQEYRTISLTSHHSEVMLRIILNRLKSKAKKLLAEERVVIRAGRSTVEQIINRRNIIEKHLQHPRELFHNFLDLKKEIYRDWHYGLWHVLRGFNIDEGLVIVIQELYGNASSAALLRG